MPQWLLFLTVDG